MLEQIILKEFLEDSAIARNIFKTAVMLEDDLEYDPYTHEVTGTPLHERFGWDYKRFRHQANPNMTAALFFNETGQLWQGKIFSEKPWKNSKQRKYLAPRGIGDVPFLPPIPRETIEEIAKQYNLDPPLENEPSWHWIKKNKSIPILLTEGAKKSLAAFSNGIVTISLFGCSCGVNFLGELKPALKPYLEKRKVYVAYDQDEKPSTQRRVAKAAYRIAKAIKKAKGDSYIVQWNVQDGKGIDDVIVNNGGDFLKERIEKAKPFKKFVSPQIKQLQKKLRSFTYAPDIELEKEDLVDGKYLPIELITDLIPKNFSGILNLMSPKGSGKSTLIEALVKIWRNQGKKVITITPRIALGRAQSSDWGIEWIVEIDEQLFKKANKLTIYENQATLGLCFDSIWKIAGRDFDNTVVILDESELGLSHQLMAKTCKDIRPKLLNSFEKIAQGTLAYNGILLLSDADLTDISVDYVKALAPENTEVFSIVNRNKPNPYQAYIYNQKKWLKQEILNRIELGERIMICTDSQAQAETLDRELSKGYPDKKIDRIDATTTREDYGKDFVKRVNESIKKERPDILIITPSMGTGTSIDGKIKIEDNGKEKTIVDQEVKNWFDQVFGIFEGVLTPSQCRQMLMRFRQNVDRHIFIKGVGLINGDRSFDPDEINKNLHTYHSEGLDIGDIIKSINADDPVEIVEKLIEMIDEEKRQWSNPHLEAYSKFKARNNYGLSNLREFLIKELKEEGHQVREIDTINPEKQEEKKEVSPSTIEFIKGEKEQKEAINREAATAINEAATIPLDKAKEIKRKPNPTTSELNEASKAFLSDELPGVELTSDFIHDNIIKDRRRSLNAIKLFWKLNNMDAAKFYDEKEYRHKFRQFASHNTVFLPDIKAYYPMLQEAVDSGIKIFIDYILANPDKEYTQDSPEILALKQSLLFRRGRLRSHFNLTVTKESKPMALAKRVLNKFGINLKGTQKRVDGKQVWVYQLDLEKLNNPDRLSILQSLDLKWSQTQATEGLEPVTELSESCIQTTTEFCDTEPKLSEPITIETKQDKLPSDPLFEEAKRA